MAQVQRTAYVLMEHGGGDILLVVVAGSYEAAALAVGGTIREERGKVVVFPKKPEHLMPIDPEDPQWEDKRPEIRELWRVFDNGTIRFGIHRDDEPMVTIDAYRAIIA